MSSRSSAVTRRNYAPRHAVVPEPSHALRHAAVLATTVGAAAVTTTALAGPAEAKSHHHTVWDRVASCESGNRWHIATGNGYYGGLQFSSGTWRANGGGEYASRANHASRGEQIQVARRVLKHQGRNAWPVCGPRAGLTRSSGHATGARLPAEAGDGMPSSGGSTQSSHRSHHSSHHSSHQRSHHKSRSHHRHTYVVHSGDTLSSIAAKEHVHGGWHALYRANRHRLHNPNVLRVGEHIRIP